MSLTETMADKSGVIASGMLEVSAKFKDQMSFLIHVKRKNRSDRENRFRLLKIRSGYLSLQLAVWARLYSSLAQVLQFD